MEDKEEQTCELCRYSPFNLEQGPYHEGEFGTAKCLVSGGELPFVNVTKVNECKYFKEIGDN